MPGPGHILVPYLFIVFGGPLIWGYLCARALGRLHKHILGLPLVLLPFLLMAIFVLETVSPPTVLLLPLLLYLIVALAGYTLGILQEKKHGKIKT